MIPLALAVVLTLAVSAFCSLLEAMVLSTTTADIQGLKKRHPARGLLLERFRAELEETSSAILSLNTIANTAGASICGAFAITALGQEKTVWFSASLVLGILIFSEVIPKNIGVLYRPVLLPWMVYPLHGVRLVMHPVSYLCSRMIQAIAGKHRNSEASDEEILLLAEKGAKEGQLTENESSIISGALSLDDTRVEEIMTPRTVVFAFDQTQTVGEVFKENHNIPFARIPVYNDSIDNITGLIRRRDLLKAKAEDRDSLPLSALRHDIIFVPEQTSIGNALQLFLQKHQQFAAVVDEFGSVSGVVTMEDVIEQIIGSEIWETDDPAVDMRELARQKQTHRENALNHRTAVGNSSRDVASTASSSRPNKSKTSEH